MEDFSTANGKFVFEPSSDYPAYTFRLAASDLARFGWAAQLPRAKDGQVLVPLFSDLKRHVISDPGTDRLGNELLAQRFVERNQFRTAFLWGVGSTAPYGHRGDITTLRIAIEEGATQVRLGTALFGDRQAAR